MNTGAFVISLDVEMYWGVTGSKSIDEYSINILNEASAVCETLGLFKQYNIKGTWCIVGFLLAKNKKSLFKYLPYKKPVYSNLLDNTYTFYEKMEDRDEKYFFNTSILKDLQNHPEQEIGSHSFSHYYSNQCTNEELFSEDVIANEKIFQAILSIKPTSYVFPRNQVNTNHLKILKDNNFTCYRGNDKNEYYFSTSLKKRAIRLADSYINITGYHTHKCERLEKSLLFNVPASFILRPYSKFRLLNKLQLMRLKKAMKHAAKNKELFHLWWHPHNFGNNIPGNISFLKNILEYYKILQHKYQFSNFTMSEFSKILN